MKSTLYPISQRRVNVSNGFRQPVKIHHLADLYCVPPLLYNLNSLLIMVQARSKKSLY